MPELSDVKSVVGDLPFMSVERAALVTTLIHDNDVLDVLELGFSRGVSTCYIAAALAERDNGHLVTIDSASRVRNKPRVEELLDRLSIRDRVTIFYEYNSYNWRMRHFLEQAQTPQFDLIFLDGPHSWEIDGFAFLLAEKFLAPGGLIVFAGLHWTFDNSPSAGPWIADMPEDERVAEHVNLVFELLVKSHPNIDECWVDGQWGYARKHGVAATDLSARQVQRRVLRDQAEAVRVRSEVAVLGNRWIYPARPRSLLPVSASDDLPTLSTPGPPAPFIVGSPRSGTTLLRMMLDSHPDVAIPNETHFIGPVARAWSRGGENSLADSVEAMIGSNRWADFGLDAQLLRTQCMEAEPKSPGALLRLFYGAYSAMSGKPRWGDKSTPYTSIMPTIFKLLPEARFIHIIRDGRDATLSVLPLWFGPDTIEEGAHWWVKNVSAALRDAADVPYLEVRFEQLVVDPEPVLKQICTFVGLTYFPEMLAYGARAHARLGELKDIDLQGQTVSAEKRRRNDPLLAHKPDAGRAGRWRTEMTAEDRHRFEAIAGTLLEQLGYPLS